MNAAPALPWESERLQASLQALRPGLQVEVVASTASTNADLLQRMQQGEATPVLRVAEQQTAGRGRLGRSWLSAPVASLTFSLALPYAPPSWSGLSLALGVALAEAIDPGPERARVQLKWPNDLWLADGVQRWRKLGGILIETLPLPEGARGCVIGIGLNVRPRAPLPELTSGYACVQELDAQCKAPALLARVAPALLAALQVFEHQGFAPFAPAYAARDLLHGLPVTTSLPDYAAGVAEGVDDSGALRLRHAAGVARLHSGEISVRPAVPAPPVLPTAPGARNGAP